MSPVPIGLQPPELLLQNPNYSRFLNLRGVRWRIDLGILPSSPSASIEELRRAAADCRRRYASLRRRLLIDPHLLKDGSRYPDLTMDNPLSQNPESTWGRFFRNAELEKLLDQDLSRLYPQHENYFQTSSCQAMLRRILLVWCLGHAECGYRQGMHELLASLLYVLHMDLQYLSQIRALYKDRLSDKSNEVNFPEGDMEGKSQFTKSSSWSSGIECDNFQDEGNLGCTFLDDLDPVTKELFLLNDAYGAEGELGLILSERFMEHDAYCMFDGLMSGSGGVVAMAELFSPSPIGSTTGLPPVIEASSALYHILSIVDSSLHNHLIELGVEPQYFALRWLRVLFGREFALDDLLLIWDELLSSSNTSIIENEPESSFKILCSPRGAFITTMTVAMLVHLRSSLLASENATSCLQRLLNFPKNTNVKKLIEKAKSLQSLAIEKNISPPSLNRLKPQLSRVLSLPSNAGSPKTPKQSLPDSYWEEKWRMLHKDSASQKVGDDSVSRGKVRKIIGDKFMLTRTVSVPSPAKKDSRSSTVGCQLLNDLTDVNDKMKSDGNEKLLLEEPIEQSIARRISFYTAEETNVSGENSSEFSVANSPHSSRNDSDNDSESSTATSNYFAPGNDEANTLVAIVEKNSVTSAMNSAVTSTNKVGSSRVGKTKLGLGLKDRISGKFLGLLKFRKGSSEGNLEKVLSNVEHVGKQDAASSGTDKNSYDDRLKAELGEKKAMGTLKSLGQSMLQNIQVIESVFQQEQGQTGNIIGVTPPASSTMAALEELRKISSLLSEM